MIKWQNRIPESFKTIINIELAKTAFANQIEKNKKDGFPEGVSIIRAKKKMTELLKDKGILHQSIVHFLHVCEVTPYSGCGCCEHRKS